ncbi:DUF6994 family protein [Clostridium sporogenes]|uniref:DUF6994 family protein n=1 Tax=Clostridium sporogenes TaxID=1509 RepID=UPI0022378291|nr:hypothetical protein [Clostridium sporogenes]MCW6088163.1 hypothetical protein [Clostridium sporogenes]
MYTYEKNIELIKLLYNSKLANELCGNSENNFKVLRPIIESFYKDPDFYDRKLFINNDRFNNIKVGLDGLCGWKILFDIHDGNIKWLEDYEAIRGSQRGYLIWPNSTKGRQYQTINQLRYNVFGDRIDYTLFDIDLFLKGEECRLAKAYVGDTKDFLEKFGCIENLAKDMNLKVFLDKNRHVKNLDGTTETITREQHKKFSFSSRWGATKKKEVLSKYIENIVIICKEKKLTNSNLTN